MIVHRHQIPAARTRRGRHKLFDARAVIDAAGVRDRLG